MNRNCLSYWYPLLADLPMPRTEIVQTSVQLIDLLDGQTPDGWEAFLAEMSDARERIGGDCFLRTGQTSGKHDWERTCWLPLGADLGSHICALVEFSEMADFIGLPSNVWVLREVIKTAPLFHAFRGFPVTREFRVFVEAGQCFCIHPYWPKEAIAEGRPDDSAWERKLAASSEPYPDTVHIGALAKAASKRLPGAWSVDVLQDATGKWWLTDCADAGCSFHWSGCENEKRWKLQAFAE